MDIGNWKLEIFWFVRPLLPAPRRRLRLGARRPIQRLRAVVGARPGADAAAGRMAGRTPRRRRGALHAARARRESPHRAREDPAERAGMARPEEALLILRREEGNLAARPAVA